MKLTAKKSLRYAGRALVAGDDFEASDRNGRILKAIGRAGDYAEPPAAEEEPKPERAMKYRTRRLKADTVDAE